MPYSASRGPAEVIAVLGHEFRDGRLSTDWRREPQPPLLQFQEWLSPSLRLQALGPLSSLP